MTSYPTITVWQPWATLIAIGAKPFEFRSWSAPAKYHNQRIAIHAGARPVSLVETRDLLEACRSEAWRDTGLLREPAIAVLAAVVTGEKLPLSSVLCTATLGRPIRNAELEAAMGLKGPVNDSDRSEHTNWGWPLTDIRVLQPFLPARGRQGIWIWSGV